MHSHRAFTGRKSADSHRKVQITTSKALLLRCRRPGMALPLIARSRLYDVKFRLYVDYSNLGGSYAIYVRSIPANLGGSYAIYVRSKPASLPDEPRSKLQHSFR